MKIIIGADVMTEYSMCGSDYPECGNDCGDYDREGDSRDNSVCSDLGHQNEGDSE